MSDPSRIHRPLGRSVLRLIADIYRARPRAVLGLALVTLATGVRTGIYMLAIRGISQGIVDRDLDAAVLWGVVFAMAVFFENTMWLVDWFLTSIVIDHAVFAIQERVLTVASQAELVAFEHRSFAELLKRATDAVGMRLVSIISGIRQMLVTLSGAASVIASLWVIDPWLIPILIAGAIPGYWLQLRVAHLVHAARLRHARTDVVLDKLATLLTTRSAAAEIRLFGSSSRLVDQWIMHQTRRADEVTDALRTQARSGAASELWHVLAIGLALSLVLWQLLERSLPLGSWVMITTAASWTISLTHATLSKGATFRENASYIDDIFAFEDEADRILRSARTTRATVERQNPAPAHVPNRQAMRIEAHGISFRYPGTERAVIDDITLTIREGEHVAIVGENGAGKSTLVRLLTGLYVPEEGTVLQDGIDTRSESALVLRQQIGAVFQHYSTWQLTLRENIGFGDIAHCHDDARLADAATRAGTWEMVDDLPEGWESWLGRTFGNRDLSGGEWQRIAVARAFFRSSRFLALDEPTSALDPLAEQRIFDQFLQLTVGRTAITVSHRLGPARFADRIMVMERGKIAEVGTHDELMAANGRYCQMFDAQAAWYRDSASLGVSVLT